jgi:ACS family glucarate transporter-like MFS transporter
LSDSLPAPSIAQARDTSVRWAITALLILASFIAYVLRQNINIAAAFMKPDLGLTDHHMGWIFGAYSWGYALFQFPGGLFGERVGARRALAVTALLWVVITLLTGLLPGRLLLGTGALVACLIVLRFLLGVFQAPLFPLIGGVIAEWFPRGAWALPNGLTSTGLTLGAAAASPFVAWAMTTIGWRESFLMAAPVALLMIAVWWWYATDTPAQHPRIGRGELALILADRGPHELSPGPTPAKKVAWRKVLANRDVRRLAVCYFAMNYVFYFFSYWLFIYLTEVRGFSVIASGWLGALPWMAGAVGASAGGWLCDHLCQRIGPKWGVRVPGAGGLLLVALFLVLGAAVDDPYLAVALLALCFGCTQLTEGAYWSSVAYIGGAHTPAAAGVMNTGGNLPGIVVGPLIPYLVDGYGWPFAVSTGALAAVLGAALWMGIRVDRPLLADGTSASDSLPVP